MTIRKTLLIAFLLVGLAPLILLSYLGYVKTREAMQTEIEQSLALQAATLSSSIDKILFERLQNAAIWNRLEIMQDISINDVDKRLSNFLAQLNSGYSEAYAAIYCTDTKGHVIASSDTHLLNTSLSPNKPWLHAAAPNGEVTLDYPTSSARWQAAVLAIHAPIESAFGKSRIGDLTLLFKWSQIDELLNQAAKNGQILAILDEQGRIIAASQSLPKRDESTSNILQSWLSKGIDNKTRVRNGAPLWDSDIIIGFDRSSGYAHFPGFGWSTLIIQPLDLALAPVHHMALALLSIVTATIIITIGIATWIAQVIASPILSLTRFTRRYAHDKTLPAAPRASGEVGELTGAFMQLMRDIDDSKQQLIRASKLAIVGEMAAAIAHEVRTPLGILRSSAQILRRETTISAEGRELTEFIDAETERLNRLIATILEGVRQRPPNFQRTNVHELVNNCMAMLDAQAKDKSITIAETSISGDPWVDCDAEQMTQVVLNILLNALQILPAQGAIEISSYGDEQTICIEIADNGPGVPSADRERIFDAFFFQREGGIGLGLAIVQQIVSTHGGNISVADSRSGGALFRVSLPRTMSDNL